MSAKLKSLLVPFRRDKKRDFASGVGAELLASKVRQVLATEGDGPLSSGELPWRTAFGSQLDRLRHQRSDLVLVELARVYVQDALRKWLPEAEVTHVELSRNGAEHHLLVAYREQNEAEQSVRVEINE